MFSTEEEKVTCSKRNKTYRSTSKLRKEPGMDKRCYRCGAVDHKTPQCPNDPANINLKRAANASCIGGPEQKRFIGDGVYVSLDFFDWICSSFPQCFVDN